MHEEDENLIWEIADIAASQVGAAHIAYVESYNPADHTAKVTRYFGKKGVLSDDLPIKIPGGARYAPKVGQPAFCVPELQDAQALYIAGFIFDDDHRAPTTPNSISGAPTPLAPGEWEALGARSGNMRLNEDGSLYLKSATAFNAETSINTLGDVSHDGNLTNTKNTSVGTGFTGTFTTVTGDIVQVYNGIIVSCG